ncbi:hypothetical protein CsSME_00037731 [Camellia sinensis var. sinensis]
MVAKKDHMLAFNLSNGLYLPANMEHYDHLTKLKAIWLATKSMVLVSRAKSHIVHKRVLELRKTALLAITDADAKVAELKEVKAKLTELATENERLAELVNATGTDKQKAVTEKKDRYLRELAKLEKRKNTEVQELKRRWRTPRTMVSKKVRKPTSSSVSILMLSRKNSYKRKKTSQIQQMPLPPTLTSAAQQYCQLGWRCLVKPSHL